MSDSTEKRGVMDVRIKKLEVEMAVKSSGMELEIREPNGTTRLGDCYVTMTGLTWCKGKTTKANGVKISWNQLIEILASKESLRAAVAAARQA
jgi:hypothetical protein